MRLVERFEAARAAELFAAFRPTLFFGVPTMYVRLLELPRDVSREIGRHVRLFVSGSAPLPSAVFDAFRDQFGHAILERYGMSETLMNISNPYVGERRAGTVGFPLPGVSMRIVNDRGRRGRRRRSRRAAGSRTERLQRVLAATRPRPRRRSPTGGSGPATSPSGRPTATTRSAAADRTSSSRADSTSTRARSRSCCSSSARCARPRSSA